MQTGGRAAEPGHRARVPAQPPGWESPARAAALTCQTLAPRPQARAPPGRLPSPGTRPRPPPELRAPRVTGGTEAGNAATGPERREAYIGGAGKATPRSTFLSGSRLRSPGTASRQPRSAAPGPSPEAPPRGSGRVSGSHTPPPQHRAFAILLEAGSGQCARAKGAAGGRPAVLELGTGLRSRSSVPCLCGISLVSCLLCPGDPDSLTCSPFLIELKPN